MMATDSELTQFEMELKKFDRKINIQLFVLIGICGVMGFIYKRSSYESNMIDIVLILCLVLSVVYPIFATVKGKKRICLKYNLICSQCGKVPKALFAVGAMRSGKCPGCGREFGT